MTMNKIMKMIRIETMIKIAKINNNSIIKSNKVGILNTNSNKLKQIQKNKDKIKRKLKGICTQPVVRK